MPSLAAFVERLRAEHGDVPDFDPAGGGAAARLLILLETPGPRIGDTGVVSIDNPSGTARNLRRFLADAGIAQGDLVLWNAVPWVIHGGGPNRAPRPAEMRAGLALLPPLLERLPALRAAVLAGRIAAMAEPVLQEVRPGLPILCMPHPSPTYVCTSPDIPRRIAAALRDAAAILEDPAGSYAAESCSTAGPTLPGEG